MSHPYEIPATVANRDAYVDAGAPTEMTRRMLAHLIDCQGALERVSELVGKPDAEDMANLQHSLGQLQRSTLSAMYLITEMATAIRPPRDEVGKKENRR